MESSEADVSEWAGASVWPSIKPEMTENSMPGLLLSPRPNTQTRARRQTSFAPLAACLVLFLTGCSVGVTSTTSQITSTPPSSSTNVSTVSVAGAGQTRLGSTTQFTATVTNASSNAVTWQVNGVNGGSSATGTISSSGLYTPPATLPSSNQVTIGATSTASTAYGSMAETLLNPVPSLTSASATQVGTSNTYTIDVFGSGFLNGAQIELSGSPVTTTFVSATELSTSITVAYGTTTLSIDVVNPSSDNTPSTAATAPVTTTGTTVTSAARLLDQATFGPTLADIQHVEQVGIDPYLTEQFNTPTTLLPAIPDPPTGACNVTSLQICLQSTWWQTAITGNDQLRQRVAFALSEIFVVSVNGANARSIVPYHNSLANDAFGNFSTLMKDVTLSSAMGLYLNMWDSDKPGTGQIANENYAREFMQLFTTGINELNQDGTLKLDSNGNPIPVYTQAQVQAFARAYTGWTSANSDGSAPTFYPNNYTNYTHTMVPVESHHDTTAKILLSGTVLPAGQTAEQDVDGAIANIFAQSNVGPFVCRQLIQHLVASNPSPAYVSRIAAIFADDGSGVRGNLQAVIRGILEDPEARAGDTDPTADGGHLRESILYLTDMIRSLGITNTSPTDDYGILGGYSSTLGETPYAATSVFNFFPPNFVIPGASVTAPEFSLENTGTAILRLSIVDQFLFNKVFETYVDLSATSAWGILASKTGNATTDAGNLVDALGILFMHGQMPAAMRTVIVNHVASLPDIAQRVRVAIYLVITSSQYKIEH